ncbi:DUF4192 domain-containing protein [Mycobacteroides salmoniphilum]|uniref:DUF4192 domain-containing protein n=1 Tax=Mycobacteroides salmoniphilum TaxID=404941 RepID=A0A4R8SZT0_9MYCO|nr:DUF4192 domain-containing protein [Mycobacteroides salmoniphilum]TEA09061.1 hypothetical protein CCUG60884_00229 [Mycobacteroides salmoniphilum]
MFALKSPADVAKSLPGLLGHIPHRSVVIVLLDADRLFKAVMRADLGKACADDAVVAVANHAATEGATGALIVVVDEDASPQSLPHRELIERFDAAFTRSGVVVIHSFVVDRIGADGQWWCSDGCGAGGALGDTATSALTADAVAHGRRIYDSREELLAAVAADDSRSQAFASAVEAFVLGSPDLAVREALEAAERIADGNVVSDEELTRVAASLVDVRVRDRLLGKAATEGYAVAAEQLWAELARITTGRWRAEALTLLGASCYLRGDGPLALAAFNAALEAVPDHTLSRQLWAMLELGFTPGEVRQALSGSCREAESA